jgi:hypothetical protein
LLVKYDDRDIGQVNPVDVSHTQHMLHDAPDHVSWMQTCEWS